MEKKEKKFSGVIVPMVTPVNADFTIDRDAVDSILKTFTVNPVDAFLLGTTGESTSVPEDEKTRFVDWAVKSSGNKIRIYVGISGNCLKDTINTGKRFADLGADALVAHLPYYYPISEAEMIRFFESLADKLELPLILYNNPATARWSMPLDIIEKLSYHSNIAGIKDSERDMERLDRSIELWGHREDFSYLLGWAAKSAYSISKGGNGIVPSMGNLAPDLYSKLYTAAIEGHKSDAERYQKITNDLSDICQKDKNLNESIPTLKVMLSAYGLCNTYVLPPMTETDDSEQIIIKEKTKQMLAASANHS